MKTILGIAAAAVTACMTFVSPAQALTSFQLETMQGSDLKIDVTLENFSTSLVDGVKVDLSVAPGYYADMRSVYFHIADESLLNNIYAVGLGLNPLVWDVDANNVDALILGNDVQGLVADTYGGFDVGLGIGTITTILDDIDQITFYVFSDAGTITEEMFQTLPFAVHAESVGTGHKWYQRLGSSDLAGIVPGDGWDDPNNINNLNASPDPIATPEPATAALGLLGLAGLAMTARRRR